MHTFLLCVAAWLALCAGAVAQPVVDREPRPARERAAVVGAVAVPLAAGGAVLGWTDGIHNERAWCVDAQGYSAPDCLELNRDWHVTAAGGRALVLVAVASGLAAGSAADLSLTEAGMVGLSASMVAGLAFNLGHNAQQGQPYHYLGTVAGTDRLGRRLGTETVFWVSAGATAAVIALTVWALR